MFYGNVDYVESGQTNDGVGKYHSAAFGEGNKKIDGTVAIVSGKGSQEFLSEVVSFSTSAEPGACNDQVVDFQSNW